MNESESYRHASPALNIEASIVPWDSELLGFLVAQVERLEVLAEADPARELFRFFDWRAEQGIQLISARLPHQCLAESFLLEQAGFRFIEMVLHPVAAGLGNRADLDDTGLTVGCATASELPALQAAAASAFSNERFHLDPRLDTDRANARYAWFVEQAFGAEAQELLVVREEGRPVAFFVTQDGAERTCHWYLTAVLPAVHGRGLGHRAWRAVMRHHRDTGIDRITTTISARNFAVLGLYAKLNFRFLAPEMTFHWMAE